MLNILASLMVLESSLQSITIIQRKVIVLREIKYREGQPKRSPIIVCIFEPSARAVEAIAPSQRLKWRVVR